MRVLLCSWRGPWSDYKRCVANWMMPTIDCKQAAAVSRSQSCQVIMVVQKWPEKQHCDSLHVHIWVTCLCCIWYMCYVACMPVFHYQTGCKKHYIGECMHASPDQAQALSGGTQVEHKLSGRLQLWPGAWPLQHCCKQHRGKASHRHEQVYILWKARVG